MPARKGSKKLAAEQSLLGQSKIIKKLSEI